MSAPVGKTTELLRGSEWAMFQQRTSENGPNQVRFAPSPAAKAGISSVRKRTLRKWSYR
jgi:hypothetical protein